MSNVALARETGTSPAKRRWRVSRQRLALAALAVMVGSGGAWYGYDWWTVGRFIESTDDAYVGGNVTAISPHVSGFVTAIAVIDNQHVREGQLLVRLDARDYQAALDHANAVLAARAATLASLRAQYVLQQSTIRQAAADLDAKVAHGAFTRDDALRYATLAKTPAGTRQEAERAWAADQEAQSGVTSAQAGLAAAQQRLDVIEADIQEAQAAVSQALADLQTARLNLGYTEIRSPTDGYVGNRNAQIGQYASTGAYLLSIAPSHGLWVDANFKEDQLAGMRPGQPVTVIADINTGHIFHGHLLSLAPSTGAVFSVIPPENATGNFTKIVQRVPVRIGLDAEGASLGVLRPGLSTTVGVDTHADPKSKP